jgi:Fasciclin domain
MFSFSGLRRAFVLSVIFAAWVEAQSFLTAISQFPQLSNFTTLMYDNPGLAGALLTSNATSLTQITVLVPDNSAFDKLEAKLGTPIGSLTVQQLEPILQYHLLAGKLTTNDFTVQNGTTVPTFLNGPKYNNRTAGAALGSSGAVNDPHNGQVIFIQATSPKSKRFVVRQLASPIATVQGGLGHQINMTAVDGYWDGGVFQIVDK